MRNEMKVSQIVQCIIIKDLSSPYPDQCWVEMVSIENPQD